MHIDDSIYYAIFIFLYILYFLSDGKKGLHVILVQWFPNDTWAVGIAEQSGTVSYYIASFFAPIYIVIFDA